jgi:hypothetical protein
MYLLLHFTLRYHFTPRVRLFMDKDKHRYLAIPRNVNEDLLSKLMDDGALPDSNVTLTPKCSLTVHPKVGLKFCRE